MNQFAPTDLPIIRPDVVVGKSVLVRADLEADSQADPRWIATKELVAYLKSQKAGAIKVVGHGGDIWQVAALGVTVNYNLRVDASEEANSIELAAQLGEGFDVYVNEAFGTSHRRHTSIDALPRWMARQGKAVYCGPRFAQEVEMLEKILNNTLSDPPLNLRGGRKGELLKKILIVGGAKVEDKAKYADELEKQGWTVLRGGLLPGADLRPDGLDVSEESISNFKFQISNSQVIVTAGVMGKYEDPEAEKGTKEILQAIATSSAYKVAGGGDVEAAIAKYGLTSKFDWISVGGGAMLEFLATGTLPGIEALTV